MIKEKCIDPASDFISNIKKQNDGYTGIIKVRFRWLKLLVLSLGKVIWPKKLRKIFGPPPGGGPFKIILIDKLTSDITPKKSSSPLLKQAKLEKRSKGKFVCFNDFESKQLYEIHAASLLLKRNTEKGTKDPEITFKKFSL